MEKIIKISREKIRVVQPEKNNVQLVQIILNQKIAIILLTLKFLIAKKLKLDILTCKCYMTLFMIPITNIHPALSSNNL
jgi:hypothetical protein